MGSGLAAASGRGPFSVEIEGIAGPAVFGELAVAVAALGESLRVLAMDAGQSAAYREFFGPGAVDRVREFVERDGRLELTFSLAGRRHVVRVRPAGKVSV